MKSKSILPYISLILIFTCINVRAEISKDTENQLNQTLQSYTQGLNQHNKNQQKDQMCKEDIPLFDLTSTLYFIYPILFNFTGNFQASKVQNLNQLDSNTIDATMTYNSEKFPIKKNGAITFKKEGSNWKMCNLRHN